MHIRGIRGLGAKVDKKDKSMTTKIENEIIQEIPTLHGYIQIINAITVVTMERLP